MANKKVTVHKDLNRDIPKYPDQRLKLTLPIPISVNKMYINTRKGRILTKTAKQWKAGVQKISEFAVKSQGWKKDKKHVWYVADMRFFFPDKRVRDTHNTFKLLFDSLEGVVFDNDYYVLPLTRLPHYDKFNPRLELTFYPVDLDREDEYEYEAPKHILDAIQGFKTTGEDKS